MTISENDSQQLDVHIDSDMEGLIPLFLDKRTQDIHDIEIALATNDFDAIYRIGHNLKGIGAGYGFDYLSAVGAELELAAKERDYDTSASRLSDFREYMNNVNICYV